MFLDPAIQAVITAGGTTLVSAMATDAWQTARTAFARLLGRGDQARQALAEKRLDESAGQLTGLAGTDLESTRAALLPAWQTRLADLIEEHPELADELGQVTAQVQERLAAVTNVARVSDAGAVSIGGNVTLRGTNVAGRDLTITAGPAEPRGEEP